MPGLFGGSPYPVSPQVQQGLMGDAWRQFGIQLLANAQNPNLTQGLAAALASGRQAYAGGAEQAYNIQQDEDKRLAEKEYRGALAEAARARAEASRSTAEAARDTAEAEKQSQQALAKRIEDNPFLSPAQKEAALTRLASGDALTEGMLLPKEEPTMTPYQREQVRLAEERLGLQRARASQPVASTAEPAGLSPTKLAQMLAGNMSMLERRARENPTYNAAGEPIVPPPHVIRAQAEELLRQQLAAVGRASGQPAGSGAGGSATEQVEALAAQSPDMAEKVRIARESYTDEQILEFLSGGQ